MYAWTFACHNKYKSLQFIDTSSNSFIIQSKQNRSDEGNHHGAVNEPGSHRLWGLIAGRQTGQQNFLHSLNYLEFYFIFYYHSSCYSVINVLQLF